MTENRYQEILVYADVTVRVSGHYQLDKNEYREWNELKYGVGPDPFRDLDFQNVVEFLTDSTDTESEVWTGMPEPDVNVHDIISSEIVEAEYG